MAENQGPFPWGTIATEAYFTGGGAGAATVTFGKGWLAGLAVGSAFLVMAFLVYAFQAAGFRWLERVRFPERLWERSAD